LVRLIGGNGRKAANDSFDLNIWWNLNILRPGESFHTLLLFPPSNLTHRYQETDSILLFFPVFGKPFAVAFNDPDRETGTGKGG
jgi:hypothetical protein